MLRGAGAVGRVAVGAGATPEGTLAAAAVTPRVTDCTVWTVAPTAGATACAAGATARGTAATVAVAACDADCEADCPADCTACPVACAAGAADCAAAWTAEEADSVVCGTSWVTVVTVPVRPPPSASAPAGQTRLAAIRAEATIKTPLL